MINIDQLRQDFEAKIAALDSASSTEDLMLATAALDNLTEDRINTVATVNDLPTLNSSEKLTGSIFFVKSINTLVFAGTFGWLGIDSRNLRRDYDPTIASGWGLNSYGQLGDASFGSAHRSSPVTVVGGITNWSQISAGNRFTFGLTDTGIAYTWGCNFSGELGDGTRTSRSSPATITGGISKWIHTSAAGRHCLGVSDAGVAYAWGNNGGGNIGDGTRIDRSSPVTVIGGITNWSQVSAGLTHSLGLTDSGILYAWGNNQHGRLGDATTLFRSSPVTVVGGITNWSQISAGYRQNVGVTDAGIAYTWGNNQSGQLGDNTRTSRSSPVTVVGITNWAQVSSGTNHMVGVTDAGIAYAWGNNYGELGTGSAGYFQKRSSPVTVIGAITNWSQVAAGGTSSGGTSFGVTDTGILYAWGYNQFGALGDGTTTRRSSPVTVIGGITTWTQVAAAMSNTFSLGIYTDPT